MKKEIKGFALGVLTTVIIGSGAAFAASQLTSIDVYPNNVSSIYLEGIPSSIPSFTYNDSTYVQLRPILEGLNCSITYDSETKSIFTSNNFRTLTAPFYIERTGKFYQGVGYTAYPFLVDTTLQANSDLMGYIDINVLSDLGLQYDYNASNATNYIYFK